ncbi:hypothetical protein BT63DRAFT_427252 [Microthyrium microscopicum]|uniref:Spherulin 4-like cell surface protein n=1 Tax=Microthyrium microscopicum TaxID=703497 RepID=A0A6A6U5C0_9PEZI|nr:hypothetical protein BT63DRAFT_427252 [Microthyrium microscopicum]
MGNAPHQRPHHQERGLQWRLSCVVFAILSALLSAVPVVANVAKTSRESVAPRSGMLIPLYMYPVPGAWDPLYTAIQTHPSVDFIVVINPASGPGAGALPDSNFAREIMRMNSYPNVRTIGYVAANYGRKAAAEAFAEIGKYTGWSQSNPQLAMQGIFLDESPQLADSPNRTFLEQIRTNVKSNKALSGGLLVMNPGMIPDNQILQTADRTVVFEERYQTYVNLQAAKQLAALPDRNALVCLMHSIPADMDKVQIKAIVNELRELAGSIFLTDLSDLYYQQFSPRFQDFVDAMV